MANKKLRNKNKKKKNSGNNKENKKINNAKIIIINDNNNNNNSNDSDDNNNNDKCSRISTYNIYNIKVGERNYCLTPETLKHDAPNFFTVAFFGHFSEANTTSIFIERDPTYFDMIVRYLRGYQVDWPINDKTTMNNLLDDVKFYSFEKLQILLEELYMENFPEKIIPWKILTYAPEDEPVVVINIKDVELKRWNPHSLVYNVNPISKKPLVNEKNSGDDNVGNANENDDNIANDENNNTTVNAADDNNAADNGNSTNNANDLVEPNAEKGLYRLEIHGKDALATVTSNNNNGIKFENFTLKDPAEEEIFRTLTESFRTSEGSLTLSPSLKLPFLNDACVEIDGSKYYTYKELSAYFGATRGKQLYFEEIVIRLNDGAFLMRARAWTIPFYYASQPLQS